MEREHRPRVLLIGPLPMPLGGTRVSFELLVKGLGLNKGANISESKFTVIDLAVRNNKLQNVFLQLKTLIRIVVSIPNYDMVSFHASTRRAIIWGNIVSVICRISGAKLQIRFFGSDLDLFYKKSPFYRFLISRLFNVDQILLQTKGLVRFWAKVNHHVDNAIWFPTSRPIQAISREVKALKVVSFVYAGHLKKEKGIYILLQALDKLHHKYGSKIKMTFYGRCDDLELLKSIKARPAISYHGEVHHTQIPELLLNQDVFVFPTFWKGEGYPGVLIEAMMAGLPIVSTDWRYLDELVVNEYNGLLVEPKDVDSLLNAMMRLVDNPNLIKSYGENSEKQVRLFDSKDWNDTYFPKLISNL